MRTKSRAVLVSTFGSTGDVAFLSRIAQGFLQRGSDVSLLLPSFYLERTRVVLESMGLLSSAAALYPDEPRLTFTERRVRILRAYTDLIGARDEIRFIVGDESCRGLIPLARGAGLPYFQASMMPFVPTRRFVLARRSPLYHKLGWINRWRWRRIQRPLANMFTVETLSFLRKHAPSLAVEWLAIVGRTNVDPARFDRCYRNEVNHLVSVNPIILPRPPDWGRNVHLLPYTQWDPSVLAPEPALERFLSAGKPPVFLGFGSHASIRFSGAEGRRLLREMDDAVGALGERLVFQATGTAWGDAGDHNDPPLESTFCARDVSHKWLFPRCSAVVCHGGYGTIHTALRSGRPLIIYPWMTDQFLWATRMDQLGVAAPYRTLFEDLSAAALVRDLRWIRRHTEVAGRARALGDILEREDDPGGHVHTIETIVQASHRG